MKKEEDLNLKDEILTLSIPLDLPQEFILETVRKMLKKAGHKGEKGIKTNKISTAKYKIVGGVNKDSLRSSLKLYDMKKQNPKMKLYELARECKFGSFWKEDSSEERLLLSSIANRHLRRVEKIIKSVEEGKFPNVRGKLS